MVLPEPVPPEISTLQRQRPMICRISAPSGVIAPNLTSWSSVSLSFLNLRMVSAGPSIASGGTMALTREPSARRASQIGEDSSTRRPTWLTMRWQMFSSCWLSRKRMPVLLDLAGDFDEDRAGAVDHDVGDVVARQQRLQRAVAEHVVADVVEQFFLLGDRHHDVLDRDDLVDDVADFLARRLAVELGELGKVDRLDQGAEDRRLDLVIVVRAPRFDRGRGRRRLGRRERRRGDGRRRRRRAAAAAAPAGGSGAPAAGFVARESPSVPLRLPNTTALHAGGLLGPQLLDQG